MEIVQTYSKTSGSLWNYYRDELSDETNDNNGLNKDVVNSESFKYKTNNYNLVATAAGYDANKGDTKEAQIIVPLKYLGNFWETLDMPLINCEVSLALTWSADCVITSLEKRLVTFAQGDNPEVCDDSPTNATFKITGTKLYVPVVTFSAENDNKLLEQLKTGFKKNIKWNKCRSEISNQARNNNLNYLIDPIFTTVNRLFVLSFENEEDRTSFSKYYLPKVEIKDFNVLTD